MEWFLNEDGYEIVRGIISAIQSNKEYLSRIDGEIGDGDHGVNMNKGFTIAAERIDESSNLSDGFNIIGMVLMMEIGGSMGPIYGTFFESLYEKSRAAEKIDAHLFYDMLNSATSSVVELCSAQTGDKTLVDTLIPATESFKRSLENNESFRDTLAAMIEGARKGRDSTLDMVAKKGRSARLGERSRGVLDAGAVSCCIILETMAESMTRLIKSE